MNARLVRRVASLLLAVAAVAAAVLVPAGPASAAPGSPRYIRSIGGSGRPGVFSWGVQWNPVTNEILVGDYLHNKIRRYATDGNYLGDFWHEDDLGQPYSVAVDPRDGAIYVAVLKDSPFTTGIVKYDKTGNWMYTVRSTFGTPNATRFKAFYPVWMTVEEDTGDIWILDSHYSSVLTPGPSGTAYDGPPAAVHLRFDDATQSVANIGSFNVVPPGTTENTVPRLYGIDISDDDVLYISDAWNRRAYRYDTSGNLLSTFGTTQTGGDNRSVTVNDALDRVYLVDAEHSDIDVFNKAGTYIDSFSEEGNAPGEFAGGGRQLDVDGDNNVWVGDFGGFETEKFSSTGTPLLTAPNPARKPPVGLLAQPRDVAVDDTTGEVWVADAWAQRFQRFSPSGQSMGAWGERGPGGPFDMNYPRSIAIQPGSRRIWVANERGHHLQVYNYPTTPTGSPTYVAQIGQIGNDDVEANHFRWPVDIEFYTRSDGTQIAVIGDRMASSVKFFNANTFQEILNPNDTDPSDGAPMIPRPNHGTAVDPATGNVYVMNPANDRIEVYDQTGTAVNNWTSSTGTAINYFGSSGTAPGQLRDPVDGVITNGVLYVSDESQSKVSAFSLDGTYLGRWGSTYGSNTYDFKGAIGIDADAQGRIYVTDTYNDRIQVFDPAQARTYETVTPATTTFTAPAQGAVLPLAPVTITGTAADNVSVGNVELSIQDYTTGLWWNASNASWEATKTAALAAWTSTAGPATSVNWRYVFHGVSAQGRYIVEARTRDHNSNVSATSAVRTFAMTGATAPPLPPPPTNDSIRPNGTLTTPTAGAQLPNATVNFAGTATDNVAVGTVRVALKRLSDGRWWSGSATGSGFSTSYKAFDATLDAPGAASTGWTWAWTPRAAGDYQILVEARDSSGNIDSTKPQVSFTVTSNPPDANAPETTLTSPADGASLPTGAVAITGGATDDTAVSAVRLTIQDTATSQYWNGSAWSATATTVAAALGSPNSPSSTWSYTFNSGAAGSYSVSAAATDTSNNADASPASVAFTTAGAADTTAPDGTLTAPANNAVLPLGPVAIGGNASDNTGVAKARVAIRNNATMQWWTGSGWGTFRYIDATLASPGATSTAWSYTFNPPEAGSYGVMVQAVDGAGNVDATRPWRSFTVS